MLDIQLRYKAKIHICIHNVKYLHQFFDTHVKCDLRVDLEKKYLKLNKEQTFKMRFDKS